MPKKTDRKSCQEFLKEKSQKDRQRNGEDQNISSHKRGRGKDIGKKDNR